MAKFTFTSVEDGVTVTHSFEALLLPEIQERFNAFIEGSGFVLPDEEDTFEFRVTNEDFIAKEEDYMWNEAFAAKFGIVATNDVINGGAGADIISFNDYTLGDK
tara:strand:- start:114 stop:425 length:312 start_codon:yes stop_codon:yes gene_type:complete